MAVRSCHVQQQRSGPPSLAAWLSPPRRLPQRLQQRRLCVRNPDGEKRSRAGHAAVFDLDLDNTDEAPWREAGADIR